MQRYDMRVQQPMQRVDRLLMAMQKKIVAMESVQSHIRSRYFATDALAFLIFMIIIIIILHYINIFQFLQILLYLVDTFFTLKIL